MFIYISVGILKAAMGRFPSYMSFCEFCEVFQNKHPNEDLCMEVSETCIKLAGRATAAEYFVVRTQPPEVFFKKRFS